MKSKNLNLAVLAFSALTSPLSHSALTRLMESPGGWAFTPSAISADGSTLLASGGYVTGGWIWRESSGFVQLPDATYPSHGGISHDGSLVVGSLPSDGAFRYNTLSNDFEFPPSQSPDTRALALSEDGNNVLLANAAGVFIWRGDSQFQIAALSASSGSISKDGHAAAFVGWSADSAYLWTEAGGLQVLSVGGFVRPPLVSADGSVVVLLQYQSSLRFFHVNPSGVASAVSSHPSGSAAITGGSPDCSVIGVVGPNFGSSTAWSQQTGFTMVENLSVMQDAVFPVDSAFTTIVGTSSSKRILAGTTGLATAEGSLDSRIWIVDLDRSCPAELTFDAQVDDADFVQFSAAYDAYVCPDPQWGERCPADLNHDGFVDDADFTIFAGAYDQLICD